MLGTSHTKEGLRIETMQDGECKARVSFPYNFLSVIAIQR